MNHFDYDHYNGDSSPHTCRYCKWKDFTEVVKDTIDQHIVCEKLIICSRCKQDVGYWAYGNYDPCYSNLHPTEGP